MRTRAQVFVILLLLALCWIFLGVQTVLASQHGGGGVGVGGVAITLSWGNVTQPDSGTLLVMTCHMLVVEEDTMMTTTSSGVVATDCCAAMIRAAESLLERHPVVEQSMLEQLTTKHKSTMKKCEEDGSLIPVNVVLPPEENDTLRFIYQISFPKGHQSSAASNPGVYLWNDEEKKGRWWFQQEEEEEGTNEVDEEGEGKPNWTDKFGFHVKDDTTTSSSPRIKATLESALSQSGGMHRSLDHKLSLEMAPSSSDSDALVGLTNLQELEAFILLLVPQDMFIDAEDAFDDHRWKVVEEGLDSSSGDNGSYNYNYNYTLELHSTKVMDIEQPSFSSPQHAVVVHLRLQGRHPDDRDEEVSASTSSDAVTPAAATISFATKIHLRYPSPVAAVDAASSIYRSIVMLPPVLMGGTVTINQAAPGTTTTTTNWELEPDFPKQHLLQFLFASYQTLDDNNNNNQEDSDLEFLITQVASAPQEDFVWVASLTVLFSVLGAMFLGYETSGIVSE